MKHLLNVLLELGPDAFLALLLLAVGVPLGLALTVRDAWRARPWKKEGWGP